MKAEAAKFKKTSTKQVAPFLKSQNLILSPTMALTSKLGSSQTLTHCALVK